MRRRWLRSSAARFALLRSPAQRTILAAASPLFRTLPATERSSSPSTARGSAVFLNELFEAAAYAALGFEYGYSTHDPNRLVLWEAQFGDFLNGAQIVVDQYITSAEAKWGMMSGLVLLLPHGLDGGGPDHSSARVERLLQLCAQGNAIVAHPSTPANLFHLLRRQVHAPWRKPLFVMAPKTLLRRREAASALDEMAAGTAFRPVIEEPQSGFSAAQRLILCSGKIYYDLEQFRQGADLAQEVALARVEQLYPFPEDALSGAIARSGAAEIVWCQEEPENQGPWSFVAPRMDALLRRFESARHLVYAGRPALPVTAEGSADGHSAAHAKLVRQAFDGVTATPR